MTATPHSIVITALGALTPVGANAEQSSAAIAAGMVRVNEHAYYECTPEDPEWDDTLPLYVSDVPLLDPFTDGLDRLLELAIPALTEVVAKAKLTRHDLDRCGLMLALPQADQAIHPLNLPAQFIPELCRRTGLTTFNLWKTTQAGHTGVFTLLNSAIQKLSDGQLDACLVGGVDSYLLEERLNLLDNTWRLRSDRTVDGFIPGEAAAFILLETADHAKARGAPILAHLGELGEGHEPETLTSTKQSTGQGLAQAITSAMQYNTGSPGVDTVYGSLNGESYYAFEWGVVLARLHEGLEKIQRLVCPSKNCGDVGAATGALLLACAANALHKKNHDKNAASLLWTSGDGGHRMALTLQPGPR